MNEKKQKLMQMAQQRYRKIFRTTASHSWDECFTIHNNKLLFWFNTEDCSTHVVMDELV
ncbi:MAG: hypothetical protein GF398_19800 [Chitinivibrionales bacterium]|nr:hypothetical protein [Chitinivibrionales bacterium]